MGVEKGSDKNTIADELVESLEDLLEERKTKNDRRKQVDSDNPYAGSGRDRRSGTDRRDDD